jgi:hypothetical protein
MTWRWEWSGSSEAEAVEPWMRVGLGRDGALHGTALYLVRIRQSSRDPAWAFRGLAELHEREIGWRGVCADDLSDILEDLEARGVVERQHPAQKEPKWRATPLAVAAFTEAYRDRHPMVEEPPG